MNTLRKNSGNLKTLAVSMLTLMSGMAAAQQGATKTGGQRTGEDQVSAAMVADAVAVSPQLKGRWIAPSERNAAIKYLVAFSNLTPAMSAKVNEISNWETLGFDLETLNKDTAFKAAVEASAGIVPTQFVQASLLTKCTFELEYEKGFSLLLPHLGQMRSAARGLRVQARWEAANRKTDLARSYLATIIRMGRHTADDGFLISSLVGIATSMLSMSEIRMMAEAGILTAEDRDALLSVLEGLDPKDPMGLRTSIEVESNVTIHWIKDRFRGPEAGASLSKEFYPASNSTEPADEIRKQLLERMDEGMIAKDLERTQDAYRAILAAWDAPDAKAQLAAVEGRVFDNQYGLLSTLFLPALGKAHSSNLRCIEDIAKTIETLKGAKLREKVETPVDAPVQTP